MYQVYEQNCVNNYLLLNVASFNFSVPPKPHDKFCGVCLTAPHGTIFLPGFVCQLFVEVLAELNVIWTIDVYHHSLIFTKIYREDAIVIRANGIVVRCPGLFKGQAIISVADSHKFILIAMMASNPDSNVFLACFHRLCQRSFEQWILCLIQLHLALYLIGTRYGKPRNSLVPRLH